MRSLILAAGACLTVFMGWSEPALGGPFADDMAKYLVKSASPEDRTMLIKWMFSAMSLHPDLASLSSVSAQQRDVLTKSAAALFQRLLLDACHSETLAAIQNEGPQTIQYAFQILGQVAARGLLTDPHVLEDMKGLEKGLDQEKIKALLNPGAAK